MLKPGTGPPFYACVTLPCSTRYTLSNCFMNAPETSWVMATTMQGRASRFSMTCPLAVSYTHLRAHETDSYLVCRLLLEKKNRLLLEKKKNTDKKKKK